MTQPRQKGIVIKSFAHLTIRYLIALKIKQIIHCVCSVFHGDIPVITCPTRFREDWIIIENAAKFAFNEKPNWTSISEIKLLDKNGQSAGNIDFVLVAYNDKGQLIDFTSNETPRGKQRGISEKLILELAASSGELTPQEIRE